MSEESQIRESALKPYDQMLEKELSEGLSGFEQSSFGLFVSSISAGIDLSFSVLLIAITHSLFEGASDATRTMCVAAIYPVGFVFVILGRAELFTEQTTLAVVPVLHGQASAASLGRIWGLIYLGNLLGMGAMITLFTQLAPALEIARESDFVATANHLVDYSAWIILLSGAVAGWLMGLLSWLLTATRDTISQVVLVWIVAATIGIGNFHHSIVGAGEVLAGVITDPSLGPATLGYFLLWSTAGNIVGAFIFASLLKYSEGTRGAQLKHRGKKKRRPSLKRSARERQNHDSRQ